ncbi:MAG: hypothetical protein ABSC06_11510 [Rhodopila sp.]|jgi:hypothetical protein
MAQRRDLLRTQAEPVLGGCWPSSPAIIRLTGRGILQVQATPARIGRDLATGISVWIAPSLRIPFGLREEPKQAVSPTIRSDY